MCRALVDVSEVLEIIAHCTGHSLKIQLSETPFVVVHVLIKQFAELVENLWMPVAYVCRFLGIVFDIIEALALIY